MNLVIVESPTKARTLSRFLGRDYQIEATMGHVRDLPESKLGIEIKIKNKEEYEFIPDYQIIPGRKQQIKELKKLAEGASAIILATDPDREGEAIAWHIMYLIKGTTSSKGTASTTRIMDKKARDTLDTRGTFQRIVFHEITESAIKESLQHPRELDMQLVDAQQTRRMLDRLVGYKLSPLLWSKLGMRWLSAGRVQTVAVRLIADREREIQGFKPEEYWVIEAELEKNQELRIKNQEQVNQSFIARLFQIGEKKAEVKNKETADKIVEDLKIASYKVDNVETKEARRYPSPPFTTSTLQQAASNKFGWSAKRTMRAAQGLYEVGLITYHRTDSTNLAAEAINMARGYINDVYGSKYLPSQAKLYKTKSKVAQEAHEAIRPTNIKILGDYDIKKLGEDVRERNSIKNFDENLGRDAELLYSLVWKRFLACQMNEAVFDQTTVTVSTTRYINDDAAASQVIYLLKATGETMKFAGWLTIYQDTNKANQSNESNGEELKNKNLPQLTISDLLHLIRLLPQQKFTEPPARYTEASLIKVLEEKGIGRPSTYAPIISTIQDRKYVEKIEKKFHPTDLGFTVVDFLVKYFPDIFDILFTARLEDELDEVANGVIRWQNVMTEFYAPFSTKLDQVFKDADKVKMDLGETDEKCPQCKESLVIKLSKYGKFLACSNFPKCKFTKNILEKPGIVCPRCGADMVIKRTRRGKQFYGCSSYPKCTFAAWKKEDIK